MNTSIREGASIQEQIGRQCGCSSKHFDDLVRALVIAIIHFHIAPPLGLECVAQFQGFCRCALPVALRGHEIFRTQESLFVRHEDLWLHAVNMIVEFLDLEAGNLLRVLFDRPNAVEPDGTYRSIIGQ